MSSGYIYAGSVRQATATPSAVLGVCDVHRLLEGDTRSRLVQWCSLCAAWLCDDCRTDPVRRARAAIARLRG